MGRLAMLMGGLGHGCAGGTASVAAAVARPLDFGRPRMPERAAIRPRNRHVGVSRGC